MSGKNRNKKSRSRRNFLKSTAATGAIAMSPIAAGENSNGLTKLVERRAVDPVAETGGRTVSIRAQGDAHYSFSVTGTVTTAEAPDDVVNTGTATATISDETHTFECSGEFTEFNVNGSARVFVDGEPFDVDSFPHNSLTIIAPGRAEIDISASGRIEAATDGVSQPNPRRVHGTISGITTVEYAGELTYFDTSKRVRVLRNGRFVSPENALPSRYPGELRVSGARERVTVHVSHDAQIEGRSFGNVDDGTVTGAPRFDDFVARYDGNIEKIEHQSGASVEFRPSNMRIVCSAPDDADVEFGVDASEALVYDSEYHSQVSITVDAGESEQVKYYGDLTTLSIEGVDVSFDDEAHEDAIESAKLQRAAAFERTDEYQTIAAAVDARIRHDAESLYHMSVAGEKPAETVVFQTTDMDEGDQGLITLKGTPSSRDIEKATYEVYWRDDERYVEKLEINQLTASAVSASAADPFETETFERGSKLSDGQQSQAGEDRVRIFKDPEDDSQSEWETTQQDVSANWSLPSIPSLPSPGDLIDHFGSALDSFASRVQISQEQASEIFSAAIENAQSAGGAISDTVSDATDDIALNSSIAIIDSQVVLIEAIAEANDQLPEGKFWKFCRKLRPGFADSAVRMGQAGVYDHLAKGEWGCAGCIAIVALTVSVGIAAGTSAICASAGITVWWGVTACAIVVGAILDSIESGTNFTKSSTDYVCGSVADVC